MKNRLMGDEFLHADGQADSDTWSQ